MNNNLTRIAVILDRSGSMKGLRAATVSGFNEYVGKLRSQPGEVDLLLVRFDDRYEVVFDKPLDQVPELSNADLKPRGTTALFDAMGRTIVTVGEQLNEMAEADRPGKVIVMTMTDGEENASEEYEVADIAAMVAHQREVYNWEFLFFGTNQDAVMVASTINISRGSTMSYSNNAGATRSVMKSAAVASNAYRSFASSGQSMSSYDFPDDAREDAMAEPTLVKP
jgi:uncharacterized protein YegL